MMHKWRWLILLLIVAGLVVQVLFDPLAGVFNEMRVLLYRQELPMAKARWEKAMLNDYQVDVRGSVPLNCVFAARLITRQGKLVEVQRLDLQPGLTPVVLGGSLDTERPGCKIVDLTIPQVLNDLSELLQQTDPARTEINILFDPQFGYVKHYGVGILHSEGLFSPGIGDCCSSFDFANFQTLQ
jgi:hypothetical protein